MRKYITALLLLAVASTASAKFRWGPTVGANFLYYHWTQHLTTSETMPGFNVGLQGELMIPGIGFGIDMAVKYANRAGKVYFGEQYIWSSDGIGTTDLRMHTIQVPVDVRFKWTRMNGVEQYVAPFVFGGPQFNFNVASTKCAAVKRAGASVGLQCGLGVELFEKFQISGSYVWDMTYDQESIKLDNYSAQLHGWQVDFCWLF